MLVADDSATVRALVRLELETAGYGVVEAEDGQQALELARNGSVDVVLLDVEMPVLNGHDTITAMRADPSTAGIPVVFLTGRAEGADVVEALRLGAQDYLLKPPAAPELLARVRVALEVATLRREVARQTAELDRISRTDHLTGLYNRRHLDEVLALAASSSRLHVYPFTVLLADVDLFKRVNDTLGHAAGDDVLAEVATRLQDATRAEDVVGRWGGEEFLLIAPGADVKAGRVLAERLRTAVAASPVATTAGELLVTVSIGGATASGPGGGVEGMLRTADACLYEAKGAGRNRAEVAELS